MLNKDLKNHCTVINVCAGYVLSKEAVARFVTQAIPNPSKCKSGNSGAEDVEIG